MRLVAVLALAATPAPALAAPIEIGEYRAFYQGVELARVTTGDSRAFALRIDLEEPGVAFAATPPSGPLETVAQTTPQFLEETGAQFAANGGFFAPCCEARPEPKDIRGLTVSDGSPVSPAEPDTVFDDTLLIGADNDVTLALDLIEAGDAQIALTGSHTLVDDGANVAPTGTEGFEGPNPRTAAGVSEDGRFLHLVAIDGRLPGYSEGATLSETAELMLALGAFDALNLDGGGSTTMARSDKAGGSVLVNRPSGGEPRYNGNNLAVFAAPVPVPAAGPLALAGLGLFALLRRRRTVR